MEAAAFTLVELIIVMALMATMMALVAPSLARSLRGRNLDQEAKRFIAAIEWARNEAISQGVPMTVWMDVENGAFGVESKPGYSVAKPIQKRFELNADMHFERGNSSGGTTGSEGTLNAVELSPEGTPDPSSIASLQLVDRFNSVVTITKTRDGWGYEIVKPQEQGQ